MKFWQSYCKNKTVQFFLPHSVYQSESTGQVCQPLRSLWSWFTLGLPHIPCNTTHLTYKNYTASYKNYPWASIKFQEISRSCRHPDTMPAETDILHNTEYFSGCVGNITYITLATGLLWPAKICSDQRSTASNSFVPNINCLTSHQHITGHIGDRLLWVKWPKQQCQSTEGRSVLTIRHQVHPIVLQ